jgi:siroheme synthase-like protein
MMLPLVFDLTNRDVLVLGLGRIGAHKARQLLEAGARVHVITTEALVEVPEGLASIQFRPYTVGDLSGMWLVISATANKSVDDAVVAEAQDRRIFYNVVDDLERCAFYFAALHRDGEMVVAVSSSGASPSLAQWTRNTIRESLPAHLGAVAAALRAERAALHAAGESTERDWGERVRALLSDLA